MYHVVEPRRVPFNFEFLDHVTVVFGGPRLHTRTPAIRLTTTHAGCDDVVVTRDHRTLTSVDSHFTVLF